MAKGKKNIVLFFLIDRNFPEQQGRKLKKKKKTHWHMFKLWPVKSVCWGNPTYTPLTDTHLMDKLHTVGAQLFLAFERVLSFGKLHTMTYCECNLQQSFIKTELYRSVLSQWKKCLISTLPVWILIIMWYWFFRCDYVNHSQTKCYFLLLLFFGLTKSGI